MKKEKWLFQTSNIPYDPNIVKDGIQIKKKLYSGRFPCQKIEVFDTYAFGRVLVLDGIFQTSEKDEFIYHEMLCHLPMFYHPNPQKVLIIGGGDGGALEEILKHPVEKVWMVEVDVKVIEVSKKYLSSISKGAFKSEKTEVIIGDGLEFIKKYKNFFDVIILDLSDPWGPARQLISLKFYQDIKKALKKGGIISVQGGCLFDQIRLASIVFHRLKKVFSSVLIHKAPVLLYGSGELNFTVASDVNLKKVTLKEIEGKFKKLNLDLKYYRPKIHFASAVLPKYLMRELKIK
jgi:spermidine synthase